MFILHPDPYSLPCYRIGPFVTQDLSRNYCLPNSDLIDGYLNARFWGKDFIFTKNGRHAIDIALASFNLLPGDVVTILTTSSNFYISSCVTHSIEKYCKWSREIINQTKVIFVNHEFGYPFTNLARYKEYNLPIIEDCAGSFFSQDENNSIGNVGDYVIYSFPKMFPLQIGGLLVANNNGSLDSNDSLSGNELRYIKNVLSSSIQYKRLIIENRISNYNDLRAKFDKLGFYERFPLKEGTVPGVFMFKTEKHAIDLPELKKFFYAHGIQCSVFYGEEAFFIPVHQALSQQDLDYFFEVMQSFVNNSENEICQDCIGS